MDSQQVKSLHTQVWKELANKLAPLLPECQGTRYRNISFKMMSPKLWGEGMLSDPTQIGGSKTTLH